MAVDRINELLKERMRQDDPYFNYCHWPYEPVAAGVGKLRPSVLLFEGVRHMPHANRVIDTLLALRAGLGDFRCVYGLKRIADAWALELYLYDYGREQRVVSVEHLQAASQGRITFPCRVDARIPYFMFSFDLSEQAAADDGHLKSVHIYIGNPGSDVSSGIAYELTASGRQLENFYFFFDAQRHQREIEDKLRCSVFSEAWHGTLDELYRPSLKDCHTICLANKRTCDTIYFSGLTIDQLVDFLAWQRYPADYQQFVAERQHELDHLRYDAGVDYRVTNGQIEFVKSGFYGVV